MYILYYGIFFHIIFVIVNAQTDSCEEYNDFECGRRPVLGKKAIANGTDGNARNWPWHALILVRDKDNKDKIKKKFEGNIISHTAVLTGANCVYMDGKRIATQNLLVQAGTSKYKELGTLNEIGRQILPVERVLIHPDYNIKNNLMVSCDLAILFVNKLVFTEYVQPICVSGPLYNKIELFGHRAVIASFYVNYHNVSSIQVSNEVVRSDDTCVAYAPSFNDCLNEFTFCYGDISGTNPNIGIVGSGVALAEKYDNSETWYLHGILSVCVLKSNGDCDPTKIRLYTYVAPHHAWIHHHAFSN